MLPEFKILEAGIEAAIFLHFGIKCTDDSDAAIKHADGVALATEKRDLVGNREISADPLPDAWPETIYVKRREFSEIDS